MQKTIDDMQFQMNEKDAEIIRLTMCLGDEKKRNCELTSTRNNNFDSTPKRAA